MASKPKTTAKIVPHLWYVNEAVEAAQFYVTLFPDSRVDSVTHIPAETPSGPANTVPIVEFTLAGQPFMAISAGPLDPFNHSVSFIVNCADQKEIDRLTKALTEGGEQEPCGWVRDRFGLSWQIVPKQLGEALAGSDRAGAARAMQSMLQMKKIIVADIQKAYAGS